MAAAKSKSKCWRHPDKGNPAVFEEEGPGIADIKLAMQDGYSTGGGLGMGMPGLERLKQ